ncbi:MAG: zinc dependent phospholipase C family protein [Candidatus Heimdallarchaeaceae archaeon]
MLSPLLLNNQRSTFVQGWGFVTHLHIADEALDLVDSSWEIAFDYYAPEVISGSTYPDQVLQDWDNHLYYPVSGEHNAPLKVTEMVEEIRTFALNEEWDNVFFFLGVMSHYTSDINIPVHTYNSWSGHGAYEDDVSYNLANLTVVPYDFGIITNSTQFIIDCAAHANNYYWDIRDAYPDGDTYGVVLSNSTIKAITEEQLGRAIGAVNAVWNYTLSTLTVPVITEVPDVAKILVDRAHDNDYASTDDVKSFVDTLDRDVVKVIYNEAEFNTTVLAGVDLVVINAPVTTTDFTNDEITALSNWYQSGGHLLLSSRGDFTFDVNYGAMNALLTALGSDIRINDDNVYTSPADPDYLQDWYCNTGNYGLDPEIAYITENLTRKIQFFSPSSLYAETGSENVNWLMYGEDYFYQSDQDSPPPVHVYDDVDDDVGGDIIPLAGVETNGSSSLAVFGTTIWSDFDYGRTDRDNVYLVYNTIEYLLGIDLESNDDYEPYVEPTEPTTPSTETTSYPILGIISSVALTSISIITYRRKNKN